jgi:general secretion pathway protein A
MVPVYSSHFGLTEAPFNITADPSFLYLSASHQEGLAQLMYGINARRGFIVLTGEALWTCFAMSARSSSS